MFFGTTRALNELSDRLDDQHDEFVAHRTVDARRNSDFRQRIRDQAADLGQLIDEINYHHGQIFNIVQTHKESIDNIAQAIVAFNERISLLEETSEVLLAAAQSPIPLSDPLFDDYDRYLSELTGEKVGTARTWGPERADERTEELDGPQQESEADAESGIGTGGASHPDSEEVARWDGESPAVGSPTD